MVKANIFMWGLQTYMEAVTPRSITTSFVKGRGRQMRSNSAFENGRPPTARTAQREHEASQ